MRGHRGAPRKPRRQSLDRLGDELRSARDHEDDVRWALLDYLQAHQGVYIAELLDRGRGPHARTSAERMMKELFDEGVIVLRPTADDTGKRVYLPTGPRRH